MVFNAEKWPPNRAELQFSKNDIATGEEDVAAAENGSRRREKDWR